MNPFRALIANDGYAATFQSLGQYRTALLNAWPSFIDLEELADELLAPHEIRRDENGHLQHPAMPSLGENVCIAEFLSAFGLECDAVAMEDDDPEAWDRYTEAENIDCSFWTRSTPGGEGWALLEIFESEDGPSALYARRKPDAPPHSRRNNPSPFTATVTRVKRRAGELVVQLSHQAPDRMYPGTTVSLHWPKADDNLSQPITPANECDAADKLVNALSKIIHDYTVVMQAAWIEWQHGKGAEDAMGWIHNTLCGPGHIPDEDAPYGKEAQAWFDANQSNPMPQCFCGRPSHIGWMKQGFCSQAHYAEAKGRAGNDQGSAV